ncbi:OB-fold domain-containing protein [Dactylosporangium sp. NPDC005572]|uniref:Zn-ribbon domain-containing OB-fold protein n=1 Tax=Dactylosporangium sp. NPDC005572 TaxID=3156889 RepID=UPI0033B402AB
MHGTPEVPHDSRFWSEAAEGRLVFQRCDRCAYLRWPAAGVCPECLDRGFRWEEVEPAGTVWSYAVYHRAYSPAHKDRLPYNVALVELTCGVRLLSTLVGFDQDDDPMGAAVTARFEAVGDHPAVPVFGPAGSGGSGGAGRTGTTLSRR